MSQKIVKMSFTKSTKATHVYSNFEPEAAISTLYIRKSALPNTPPPVVTITIEYADK